MIKHIGSLRSKQKELENIPIIYLFFGIAMDMVGPLPKIALGNKYVFLVINQYFNWCKVKALSNEITLVDTKFIDSKVIFQYGVPNFLFVAN
jgi:hypothetical protein